MSAEIPELIQVYSRDEYSLYGLWHITIGSYILKVSCVIGVPTSARSSCRCPSCHGVRPFLSAWYENDSDWSTPYQRDLGLEKIQSNIATLWQLYGVPQ